jgi:hypothetical protein
MKTAKQWTLEQRFSESDTHGLYGYVEFEAEKFCELVKQIQLEAVKEGFSRAAKAVDAMREFGESDLRCVCSNVESVGNQLTIESL